MCGKTHWGAAFRFGIVRVTDIDFALVAAAMGRSFDGGSGSIAPDESVAGHEWRDRPAMRAIRSMTF
jgi:hypothetical protein